MEKVIYTTKCELENDGENESECLMLNELATDHAGDGLCANETEICSL